MQGLKNISLSEETEKVMIAKLVKNGGTGRNRTADGDFADLGLTTWRRCPAMDKTLGNGAGEGVRTLDFNLGKVALYH